MNSHRGPRTQKENSTYRPGRGTRSCYSGCRAPGIRCYGATAAETRPLPTRGKTQRTTPITKHQRDSGPEKHQPLITHKIISRLKLEKMLRFSPVSIIISPPLLPRVKICVISPALTSICISSRRSAGRKVEMPSPVGLCPSKSSYSRPVQSEPAPTPDP